MNAPSMPLPEPGSPSTVPAPPVDPTTADAVLAEVLAALVGPGTSPRPDQAEPLRALLNGARVLCVQATGWGKSTVYFAATRALRAAGGGPTLVVSPLLALMRDQVAAAAHAGLHAVTINSSNVDAWDEAFVALRDGAADICFISPERLAAPSFAKRVPELLGSIALVVVDEAHCISDWGHDFRPDYRRLASVIAATNARVLATTATANARVSEDIAAQLGHDTAVFRGSLARPSLRCAVVAGLDPMSRYAWVADALATMPGSGIVYCLTVAETERLAPFLRECGHQVQAYSSALADEERQAAEAALRAGTIKALVATSALGMGYDHPELGFVLHVGSPSSPVAYYQQIGRAGRAIDDACAVLLPGPSDEALWEWFATASVPDPDQARAVLLACATGPMSVVALEAETGIRRGRLEGLCKILAVDGALVRERAGWVATGQTWHYDAAHYAALVSARRAEAETMRAYVDGAGCLMEFLQRSLDDPHAGPCGRCSVCTGTIPFPGPVPSPERIAAAHAFARTQDVIIEARKRWPSGSGRSGTIVGASQGRALAFADDPAWAPVLAALPDTAPSDDPMPDEPLSDEPLSDEPLAGEPLAGEPLAGEPLPDDLVDGVIAALGRWSKSWGTRPVCVVPVPSHRHATRVRALAEAIGRAGRLPVIDALAADGPPPPDGVASAPRAQALLGSLRATGAALPSGPVLLVDDTYRSGWTMTVAAAVLREAGVSAVYPFVLHRLP